jgi:type IV pilus assembly protein PilB
MASINKIISKRSLDLFLEKKIITTQQYQEIKQTQNSQENGYIHQVIANKYATPKVVLKILSEYYDLETIEKSKIKLSFVENYNIKNILLLKSTKKRNIALIVDPSKVVLKEEIENNLGVTIQFFLITLEDFDEFLRERQHKKQFKTTQENSIIEFVEKFLKKAIHKKASDIHIEIYKQTARIRFRLDGLLLTQEKFCEFTYQNYASIITRLKILASCDISETRLPQDGSLVILDDKKQEIDVRLSVLPTKYGERIVLRLLGNEGNFAIENLNLNEEDKKTFIEVIEAPQGMVLVTGPTGSGKSTTLYTALKYINNENINILTVEDPVENYLAGIGQVQVNEGVGLTFSSVLRTFLRQDPEVILVGEMRDKVTVDVAMKAAFTGHLVFSTLHTNSAIGAIIRLLNMDIAPFIISHSLSLVVAQRLVRKNCLHCLVDEKPNQTILKLLNLKYEDVIFKKGKGCSKCDNTGFRGRKAVFELLKIDTILAEAILLHKSETEILKLARKNNFQTMQEKAKDLLKQGTLSILEFQRAFINIT